MNAVQPTMKADHWGTMVTYSKSKITGNDFLTQASCHDTIDSGCCHMDLNFDRLIKNPFNDPNARLLLSHCKEVIPNFSEANTDYSAQSVFFRSKERKVERISIYADTVDVDDELKGFIIYSIADMCTKVFPNLQVDRSTVKDGSAIFSLEEVLRPDYESRIPLRKRVQEQWEGEIGCYVRDPSTKRDLFAVAKYINATAMGIKHVFISFNQMIPNPLNDSNPNQTFLSYKQRGFFNLNDECIPKGATGGLSSISTGIRDLENQNVEQLTININIDDIENTLNRTMIMTIVIACKKVFPHINPGLSNVNIQSGYRFFSADEELLPGGDPNILRIKQK